MLFRSFTITHNWMTSEVVKYHLADLNEKAAGSVQVPPATKVENQPATVSDAINIDPNATPPRELFDALKAKNKAFRNTWNRKNAPGDGSDSAADYFLACLMAEDDRRWTDQQILDTLTAFRQHSDKPGKAMRLDYLKKTVAKARKNASESSTPTNGTSAVRIVRMSEVQPESVEWLWPGRIPIGKLTMIIGDPGLGKSTVSMDIAARVSRGTQWSDGAPNTPGNVILLTAEDGLSDTIRPRLDAANADVHRIMTLAITDAGEKHERDFSDIHCDLLRLEEAIQQIGGVRLVIIDPISAYLGKVDSYKNADVRSVLAPLAKMADSHRFAVVLIDHLNKNNSGPAIYRSQGSIAFPGRSEERRVGKECRSRWSPYH